MNIAQKGVYKLEGYGNLTYCGIAGWYYMIREMRERWEERGEHAMYRELRRGG